MINLFEIQREVASGIEEILTTLDQTYLIGLTRTPVIVTDLPEEVDTPSVFLKLEDASGKLPEAYFAINGTLQVRLSIESGNTMISNVTQSLESELRSYLTSRLTTDHCYFTGTILKVKRGIQTIEDIIILTYSFKLQGVESFD